MKKISIVLLVSICLLYSCTCQRRIERLRHHCPELLVTDTIIKKIPVPKIEFDSFFVYSVNSDSGKKVHDTIFQKGKNINVWHYGKGDTIWYQADCIPDTIKLKVADDKIKVSNSDWKAEILKQIKWIAIALLGLAIIVVVLIAILRK